MKVFITGIAGFLGMHLARAFLEEGWEVGGNDNLIGGYRENVPPAAKFFQVDCIQREELVQAMKGSDVVYHCAATPHEGLSVFSPALVTKNVYLATATALSAAISTGVKRFIFCSSMARYGTNRVPFTEDLEPRPQDPYGIAKVSSETLIKLLAQVHGFEYVIAVPHNIYGPGQKYDDPYRNVVAILINRMLQGNQPYIYGDGTQRRCFSYITDVVAPLTAMATSLKVVGEVINVGPDRELVTIYELAETIAEIIGFPLEPIALPPRPQEVRDANCSADKARRLLDYEPQCSLREGLEKMVAWVRECGPRPFIYHLELEIINKLTPRAWTDQIFNK